MALQICPKCGEESITWYIDEEVSPWTLWDCRRCGCVLEEDESRGRPCSRCANTIALLVKDAEGFHLWCTGCGTFEDTTETFGTPEI